MMLNIPTSIRDPTYRYRMPALVTKIEGRGNGIKTRVLNLGDVARHLRVNPQYPLKFWGYELGAPTEYKAGEEKYMLNGSFTTNALQEFLDRFIDKFVLCGRCKYPEILIQIKKGKMWSDCAACGANLMMDNSHKLCSFIIKNPPAGTDKLRNPNSQKGKNKVDVQEESKDAMPTVDITPTSPEVLEVIERLRAAPRDAESLAGLIKAACVSGGFSSEIRLYVILAGVFDREICTILRSNKDLTRLLRKEARSKVPKLLAAFAAYYVPKLEFRKYISTCMKLMLDGKVITEADFVAWSKGEMEFNDSNPVYSQELMTDLKAASADFLTWLETAEEDDDDGEEEEEEVKDSEATLRQKQLIKEHLAAQSGGAPPEPQGAQATKTEPPEGGPPPASKPAEQRVDLISIVNQLDDDVNIDDI